jgi:NitT/TauT family transport system substrate-binding protein
MLDRRKFLAAAGAAAAIPLVGIGRARAEDLVKVRVGYTATSDPAAVYNAVEEGFYATNGLDVGLQLIALNSTLPAALQSGSLDIGNPSPSVLLAAIDGGLDLVAIGCTSVVDKDVVNFGVVVRTGVDIKEPGDFANKKVGVPGLNAFLHILFRKWLSDKGADWKSINFVEVPYPQMPDIVRGGSVDAVVTAEPVMGRLISAGSGTLFTHMSSDLTESLPTAFLASTREWATKNADAVRKFMVATAQGVDFLTTNPAKTQENIVKYTKLDLDVVRAVPLPKLRAAATQRDMENWVKIMNDQGMLRTTLDVKSLTFG